MRVLLFMVIMMTVMPFAFADVFNAETLQRVYELESVRPTSFPNDDAQVGYVIMGDGSAKQVHTYIRFSGEGLAEAIGGDEPVQLVLMARLAEGAGAIADRVPIAFNVFELMGDWGSTLTWNNAPLSGDRINSNQNTVQFNADTMEITEIRVPILLDEADSSNIANYGIVIKPNTREKEDLFVITSARMVVGANAEPVGDFISGIQFYCEDGEVQMSVNGNVPRRVHFYFNDWTNQGNYFGSVASVPSPLARLKRQTFDNHVGADRQHIFAVDVDNQEALQEYLMPIPGCSQQAANGLYIEHPSADIIVKSWGATIYLRGKREQSGPTGPFRWVLRKGTGSGGDITFSSSIDAGFIRLNTIGTSDADNAVTIVLQYREGSEWADGPFIAVTKNVNAQEQCYDFDSGDGVWGDEDADGMFDAIDHDCVLSSPHGVIDGMMIIERDGASVLQVSGWSYDPDRWINGRTEIDVYSVPKSSMSGKTREAGGQLTFTSQAQRENLMSIQSLLVNGRNIAAAGDHTGTDAINHLVRYYHINREDIPSHIAYGFVYEFPLTGQQVAQTQDAYLFAYALDRDDPNNPDTVNVLGTPTNAQRMHRKLAQLFDVNSCEITGCSEGFACKRTWPSDGHTCVAIDKCAFEPLNRGDIRTEVLNGVDDGTYCAMPYSTQTRTFARCSNEEWIMEGTHILEGECGTNVCSQVGNVHTCVNANTDYFADTEIRCIEGQYKIYAGGSGNGNIHFYKNDWKIQLNFLAASQNGFIGARNGMWAASGRLSAGDIVNIFAVEAPEGENPWQIGGSRSVTVPDCPATSTGGAGGNAGGEDGAAQVARTTNDESDLSLPVIEFVDQTQNEQLRERQFRFRINSPDDVLVPYCYLFLFKPGSNPETDSSDITQSIVGIRPGGIVTQNVFIPGDDYSEINGEWTRIIRCSLDSIVYPPIADSSTDLPSLLFNPVEGIRNQGTFRINIPPEADDNEAPSIRNPASVVNGNAVEIQFSVYDESLTICDVNIGTDEKAWRVGTSYQVFPFTNLERRDYSYQIRCTDYPSTTRSPLTTRATGTFKVE